MNKNKYIEAQQARASRPQFPLIISPSRFYDFVYKPQEWFNTEILKKDQFMGNEASTLGTIIHACFESWITDEPAEDDQVIKEFIDYMNNFWIENKIDESIEESKILSTYNQLRETSLHWFNTQQQFDWKESELKLSKELTNDIILSGTTDAIAFNHYSGKQTIIDFKTTNKKSGSIKSIDYNYKLQAYLYAYLANINGHNINEITIIYITKPQGGEISPKTGKKLKFYPSEVVVLSDNFENDEYEFIHSLVMLCKESLEKIMQEPELVYLIFRDYRLKGIDFTKYLPQKENKINF